jgi:hypothetical protein
VKRDEESGGVAPGRLSPPLPKAQRKSLDAPPVHLKIILASCSIAQAPSWSQKQRMVKDVLTPLAKRFEALDAKLIAGEQLTPDEMHLCDQHRLMIFVCSTKSCPYLVVTLRRRPGARSSGWSRTC